MNRIQWSEEDSIEKIAVNNRLNIQWVIDLFKANDYNKAKTIAMIEKSLEEQHKKYLEHINSPEYKKTMQSMNTLLGMAGMVGAMNPYYFSEAIDTIDKYNDFINKSNQLSPKEFGETKKR